MYDPETQTYTLQGGPCNCQACCGCIDSAPFGRFTGLIRWEISEPLELDDETSLYSPGGLTAGQIITSTALTWTTFVKTEFVDSECIYKVRTDLYPTLQYPPGSGRVFTFYNSVDEIPGFALNNGGTFPGYWRLTNPAADPEFHVYENLSFSYLPFIEKHPALSSAPHMCHSFNNYFEDAISGPIDVYYMFRAIPEGEYDTTCTRNQHFWPSSTCMVQTIVDVDDPTVTLQRVLFPVRENYYQFDPSSRPAFSWCPRRGQPSFPSTYPYPPAAIYDDRTGLPGGVIDRSGINGFPRYRFNATLALDLVPNGIEPTELIVGVPAIEFTMNQQITRSFRANRMPATYRTSTNTASSPAVDSNTTYYEHRSSLPLPIPVSAWNTDPLNEDENPDYFNDLPRYEFDYDTIAQWIGYGQALYSGMGAIADWTVEGTLLNTYNQYYTTFPGFIWARYVYSLPLRYKARVVSHSPFVYEYWARVAINGKFRTVYGTITPGECGDIPDFSSEDEFFDSEEFDFSME